MKKVLIGFIALILSGPAWAGTQLLVGAGTPMIGPVKTLLDEGTHIVECDTNGFDVIAEVDIETSDDNHDFSTPAEDFHIRASGNGPSGQMVTAKLKSWGYYRAHLLSITGTNARVSCTLLR